MRKGKNNFWLYTIIFLTGALVSYILCQFTILDIDNKVNVTETILSLITAFVGLYIAVSLQKRQNRNQNLYNNLEKKLESLWELFSSFSNQLEINSQVPLNDINIATKKINQKIAPLKKLFSTFNLDQNGIEQIEKEIDSLEDKLINQSVITLNVVDYSSIKPSIISSIDNTDTSFANCLRELNNL
jgi:hypothetical protein